MALGHANVPHAVFNVGLQRPRRHLSPERRVDYPEVFWAVPAFGETDEEAQNQLHQARASAERQEDRAEASRNADGDGPPGLFITW